MSFNIKSRIRQSGCLYISMMISMALSFLVSIINARYLGPENFGYFKLIQNVYNLLSIIFTFGFFYSLGRKIAASEDKDKEKEIFSAGIVITIILSFIGICFIIWNVNIFSDLVNKYFVESKLIKTVPLFVAFMFQLCILNILQGSRSIISFSIMKISPNLLYISIFIIFSLFSNVNYTQALLIQSAAILCSFLVLSFGRVNFSFVRENIVDIFDDTKIYGVRIYSGAIFIVGSGYLSSVILGLFEARELVGYYNLSVVLCLPIQMIASVLGITLFKDFYQNSAIPRKIWYILLLSIVFSISIYQLLIPYVIDLLYGDKYIPVVKIARLMCFSYAILGLCDFLSKYLSARGLGKALNYSGMLSGLISIVSYWLLTSKYGIDGTIFSLGFGSLLYLLLLIYSYYRYSNVNMA